MTADNFANLGFTVILVVAVFGMGCMLVALPFSYEMSHGDRVILGLLAVFSFLTAAWIAGAHYLDSREEAEHVGPP